MKGICLHPLVSFIVREEPKVPSVCMLYSFLGTIAYVYAYKCEELGRRLGVLLKSESYKDNDLQEEMLLFRSEIMKLIKEINKIVK